MKYLLLVGIGLMMAPVTVRAQRMISPKPATLTDRYPKKSGSLRASAFSLSLGNVTKNTPRVDTVFLYNEGSKPLRLMLAGTEKGEPLPEHLQVRFSDTILAPRKDGRMLVAYDPAKNPDYGFVLDRFRVVTDDSDQKVKMFYVNAYLKAYFPPMTAADSSQLPKARVSLLAIDAGTVKSGKSVSRKFQCSNDGPTDLRILQAKPLGSGVTLRCDSMVIPSGKSISIEMNFDTFGKPLGAFSRKVMLFLNDPMLPEVTVVMTGNIE